MGTLGLRAELPEACFRVLAGRVLQGGRESCLFLCLQEKRTCRVRALKEGGNLVKKEEVKKKRDRILVRKTEKKVKSAFVKQLPCARC